MSLYKTPLKPKGIICIISIFQTPNIFKSNQNIWSDTTPQFKALTQSDPFGI